MKPSLPADHARLLTEIKERVRAAQYEALKAVNKEQIELYWDIGRIIVSRQEKGSWGKSIVQQLSVDLQSEFPGVKGFSAQNLWRMKQFYQAYQNEQKLSPLVREIGWSHNLIIMMWCKDQLEREFYIRMAKKFGWTKNVLIHQIENQSYEKTLLGQTNFDKALTPKLRAQAKLAVRLDILWEKLPRPPFTDEDAEHLSNRVYDHIWQRSKTGDFLKAAMAA
jgi:predicted nuclease of restriction endonuclease-like (RecB) superfamily